MKSKSSEKKIKYKTTNLLAAGSIIFGIMLIGIIWLIDRQLVYGDIFNGASNAIKEVFAPFHPTPFPTAPIVSDTPSNLPSDSPTPETASGYVSNTQQTYVNGGWYWRNGQSMQYWNGQWTSATQPTSVPNNTSQSQQNQSNGTTNQQAATMNQMQGAYNACANQVQQQNDSCMGTCKNNWNSGEAACSGSSDFGSCGSQNAANETSCENQCNIAFESGLNNCNANAH